jgi:glycosyltransferase involved in cell wall biosynthesis
MRIAWFSPLPPVRSGIAAYSAELLPLLSRRHTIDCFTETPTLSGGRSAHDFVWMRQRHPYDLVVHQIGNAPCHDFQWAYLAPYPALVVLHDARLHHARARHLLQRQRADDYRDEFGYDHPRASRDVAEYAVEGLGGTIQYLWPMLRALVRTARAIAVHNPRVAGDLREEYPGAAVSMIHMGVPTVDISARGRVRAAMALPEDAVVFAAFGKITAEKRIGAALRALATLIAEGVPAHLMLVGDAAEYPTLSQDLAALGLADRVRVTGYVADAAVGGYLAAADACLCLRWPTALETSASWLRCLAAARATVISNLPHLVDIPADAAIAVDLLDEDRALTAAMRGLAADGAWRGRLGTAGHEYWRAHHTLDAMAADYETVMEDAVTRPAPSLTGLPLHFTNDHSASARRIAHAFGVGVDILGS